MKTIHIGGQDRPISFKLSVLAAFGRSEKLNLGDMMNMDLLSSMNLIYFGLLHGAKEEGKKFIHKKEDVHIWLDEEGFGEGGAFNKALGLFAESFSDGSDNKKGKSKN